MLGSFGFDGGFGGSKPEVRKAIPVNQGNGFGRGISNYFNSINPFAPTDTANPRLAEQQNIPGLLASGRTLVDEGYRDKVMAAYDGEKKPPTLWPAMAIDSITGRKKKTKAEEGDAGYDPVEPTDVNPMSEAIGPKPVGQPAAPGIVMGTNSPNQMQGPMGDFLTRTPTSNPPSVRWQE